MNSVLSDLNTLGTSKLDWRYFEHSAIDRNELQILQNLQKGTGKKWLRIEQAWKIWKKKKIHQCAEPSDLLMTNQVP